MEKVQLGGYIEQYKRRMGILRKIFGPHPAIRALQELYDNTEEEVNDDAIISCFHGQVIKPGSASYRVLHDILKSLLPSLNIPQCIERYLGNDGIFYGDLKGFKLNSNRGVYHLYKRLSEQLSEEESDALLLLYDIPKEKKIEYSLLEEVLWQWHKYQKLTKENIQKLKDGQNINQKIRLFFHLPSARPYDIEEIYNQCIEGILACSNKGCLSAINKIIWFGNYPGSQAYIKAIQFILSYHVPSSETDLFSAFIDELCQLDLFTPDNVQLIMDHSDALVLLGIFNIMNHMNYNRLKLAHFFKGSLDNIFILIPLQKERALTPQEILLFCNSRLSPKNLQNLVEILLRLPETTRARIRDHYEWLEFIVQLLSSTKPATKKQIEAFAALFTGNSKTNRPDAKTPSLNSAALFNGLRDDRHTDSQSQQLCDERFGLVTLGK